MATQTAPNPLLEKMKKGLALQKAGEVKKAQRIYKSVIRKAPNNPDANHLLGVSYRQLGSPLEAVEYIEKAIELAPNRGPYYANLARAMSDIANTKPESVLAATEKALSLDPNLIEALNLKAVSLTRLERKEEAEEIFQRLIVRHPDFSDAYRNYGLLLRDSDEIRKAVAFFNKAVQTDPDNPENYIERARARLASEDFKNSEVELADALERFPDNGEIKHEIARLLFKMGETHTGLKYALEALEGDPENHHKHVTLGIHYLMLDDAEKAVSHLRKAKDLRPDITSLDWNLSLACLANGDLEDGWRLHPARFDDPSCQVNRRNFDVPAWHGEDISDKTVLVWADQGLGDAIKAGTMLPELIERAGKVIIELSPKATSWYQMSFPTTLCRPAAADADDKAVHDDFDIEANITDLAHIFRNSIDDFQKARIPAYRFDEELARGYLERIQEKNGGKKPIIGVGWRSRNLALSRARLYLSAPDFAPIMDFEDVTFVNLQYESTSKEIKFLETRTGGSFVNLEDVDLFDDLIAAASLTACCDLVVTANTSVAEIAGAIDVPCFRFGQNEPALLLGQDDPPWHPSMRYYLLKSDKPASAVVPNLKADIASWLETFSPERRNKRLGLQGTDL